MTQLEEPALPPEPTPAPAPPTHEHALALRKEMLKRARRELDHPTWKVQCSRIKTDGTRCKRWARRGTTVCVKHGGNAPATIAKASERIEELRAYIFDQLAPAALTQVHSLATNAEDEKVRLRAAQDLLDRAGLAPVKAIHQETTSHTTVTHGLDDEITHLLRTRTGPPMPNGAYPPDHSTGPALPPPAPSDYQPTPPIQDIESIELPSDPRHLPTELIPE